MTLNLKKHFLLIGFSLLLVLFVSSIFLCNSNIAFAESNNSVVGNYIYAKNPEPIHDNVVITNSQVAVYGDALDALKENNENKALFYLPYTYYLEVVDSELGNEIYNVKYMELDNLFIRIEDLTIKDENGDVKSTWAIKECIFKNEASPYPAINQTELELNDTITSVSIDNVDCDNTYTFNFIGSDNDNNYYVKAQKEATIIYGKVSKDNFKEFQLHTNPDAITPLEFVTEPILPPTSNALRIILIVGIAVPAVIIMIIIFLPRKKETVNEYEFMKSKKHDDIDYDRDRSLDYRDENFDDRNKDVDYERRPKFDNRETKR